MKSHLRISNALCLDSSEEILGSRLTTEFLESGSHRTRFQLVRRYPGKIAALEIFIAISDSDFVHITKSQKNWGPAETIVPRDESIRQQESIATCLAQRANQNV